MNEDHTSLEELTAVLQVSTEAQEVAQKNPGSLIARQEADGYLRQAQYLSWRFVVQRWEALKRWEWAQQVRASVDPPADDFVGISVWLSGEGPDGRPANKSEPHWERNPGYPDTVGVGVDWKPLNWDLVGLFGQMGNNAMLDLVERLYGLAKAFKAYLPTPRYDVGNQGLYWVDAQERLTLAVWLAAEGVVKMSWQDASMGVNFVDPTDDQIGERLQAMERILNLILPAISPTDPQQSSQSAP